MAVVNAAQASVKTVASPNAQYETLAPVWSRCRAICSGERYVKDYDTVLDTLSFSNLLIPFSPSMDQGQFNFYKAEAELPGITAQFGRMLVGGLLRKPPVLKLPPSVPSEATDWILNEFGEDDNSLLSFLDMALWEEVQTSRPWIIVDYPKVEDPENLTSEEQANLKPYPILHKAESVINWSVKKGTHGKNQLQRVVIRGYSEDFTNNEFHPEYIDTVWVHDLDEAGYYRIRKYQREAPSTNVNTVVGSKQVNTGEDIFKLVDMVENIHILEQRLKFVPAWPLNGSVELQEPLLSVFVAKETALYNKMSRRNHLLYGAATYTPYICSNMSQGAFEDIVESGLGSWFKLDVGDTAGVLATPTEALSDMASTIAASIEEMAKLGIRMLTPETAQSGVALEIRNASQTAQLGTLNAKVCSTLKQVIAFMINWRYGLALNASDIELTLSDDFNPAPLGADWLRLATEWYQQGLIPRSIWLRLLKQNELIDSDYDDKVAQEEINKDELIITPIDQNEQYLQQLEAQQGAQQQPQEE